MDPQEYWNEIKRYLEILDLYPEEYPRDDSEALAEYLEALATWIRSGGFWPKP